MTEHNGCFTNILIIIIVTTLVALYCYKDSAITDQNKNKQEQNGNNIDQLELPKPVYKKISVKIQKDEEILTEESISDYLAYLNKALSARWVKIQNNREGIIDTYILTLNKDGTIESIICNNDGSARCKNSPVLNRLIRNAGPFKQLPSLFEEYPVHINLAFWGDGNVTTKCYKKILSKPEDIEQQRQINEFRKKQGFEPFEIKDYKYILE